jgi:hypothetical protein
MLWRVFDQGIRNKYKTDREAAGTKLKLDWDLLSAPSMLYMNVAGSPNRESLL